MFGSVLCSPGCFSIYRAKAVRDVLPLYASGTATAMDFLMKDMGTSYLAIMVSSLSDSSTLLFKFDTWFWRYKQNEA